MEQRQVCIKSKRCDVVHVQYCIQAVGVKLKIDVRVPLVHLIRRHDVVAAMESGASAWDNIMGFASLACRSTETSLARSLQSDAQLLLLSREVSAAPCLCSG